MNIEKLLVKAGVPESLQAEALGLLAILQSGGGFDVGLPIF